jgi:predicted nicotinamide N-methyase
MDDLENLQRRLEEAFDTEVCQTRIQCEAASFAVPVFRLKNLDTTIDRLFEILSSEGKPELLNPLCPFFGVPWPSGKALAAWVLDEDRARRLPRGTLLEIGCGLALPSLLATHLLGRTVIATDQHPSVPYFLRENTREWSQAFPALPGRHGSLTHLSLDWKNRQEALKSVFAAIPARFPLAALVASDVLYEADAVEPLAELFHAIREEHFARTGLPLRIALTDPGRPYLQPFADRMQALGSSPPRTSILRAENHSAGDPIQEIFLLEFS